jgi:hypothetical protein
LAGRLPNFLIVGAMKSGTTSLARYLGAHPQAYLVPEKEVYFFERTDLWARGIDWYEERFAGAAAELAVGEASPSYMFYRRAVERMASVVPDARLIVMLREPVERAYSHYLHWRFDKVIERRSFERAVEDEIAEGERPALEYGPGEVPCDYLARSRYLPQLQHLCEHFPRESVLVILLEDLERAPEETFSQVCGFLGIDSSILPGNVGTVFNAHHQFRPVWLWRLSVDRNLWRWVPKRMRLRLVHGMARAVPHPPLDDRVRMRLREHFADHNAALAEWLGRDLSAWNAAPARAEA